MGEYPGVGGPAVQSRVKFPVGRVKGGQTEVIAAGQVSRKFLAAFPEEMEHNEWRVFTGSVLTPNRWWGSRHFIIILWTNFVVGHLANTQNSQSG